MLIKLFMIICLLILGFSPSAYAETEKVSYQQLKRQYVPQRRPEETVSLELKLLSQGMYCYDLALFDPAWRKRGNKILYSSRYKNTAKKFSIYNKVYIEGNKAVVYYPRNKSEGPDFLYRTVRGWVLDRTAVWDYIHYNRSNTGWFAYEGNYPYLKMLKRIFPLERIQLDNGVWAYWIKE